MILPRLWCSFGLLLLLVSVASAQSSRPSQTDNQEWNDVQFVVPLTKQIDFVLVGTLRFGRDWERPVDERLGVGFSFKIGKYLIVTPGYLHIATQPFTNVKQFENRLILPITLRIPVGKFRFIDRNQFERRSRHPGIESTRYRNRLQVEHPIAPDKYKLSLFVSDEVFYDWSLNHWVRNRAAVGVTKVFNKNLQGDLYYLRQNDSHSLPGDLNVIGTALRIRW
jgi:hypothetical protein